MRFSGLLAWWLWRGIYLAKLPGFPKKVRVAVDWVLDLFFSKNIVQLPTLPSTSVSSAEPPAAAPKKKQ
jgi:NADH dehydrogenase